MADATAANQAFTLSSSNLAKAVQDLVRARREGLISDGDLATILIAMPVGAAADVALHLTGIFSPGWCALGAASGMLGLKRWIHAEKRRRDGKGALALPAPEARPGPDEQLVRASEALLARLKAAIESNPAAAREQKRLAEEIALAKDPLLFDAAALMAANARARTCLTEAA